MRLPIPPLQLCDVGHVSKRALHGTFGNVPHGNLTPTGFDSPVTTTSQDSDLRNPGQPRAAKSGAEGSRTDSHEAAIDPALARVVEAWPRLPKPIQMEIQALVANEDTPSGQ